MNYHTAAGCQPLRQLLLQLSTTADITSYNDNDKNRQLHELLLQNLIEPFDRWRFLQKLLDEDINDASDILFVLQTSVKKQLQVLLSQQQKQKQRMLGPQKSLSLSPQLSVNVETSDVVDDATTPISAVTTATDIAEQLSSLNDDTDIKMKRHRAMEYIMNDVSIQTMNNLLQPQLQPLEEVDLYFLQQIEQLLPHPDDDEDAAKGLWDTVIELHGREMVKINERRQPQSTSWKTRCMMARLLIYFDFLTIGL